MHARDAIGEDAVAAGAQEGAGVEPLSPSWAAGALAHARSGSAGVATIAASTHIVWVDAAKVKSPRCDFCAK